MEKTDLRLFLKTLSQHRILMKLTAGKCRTWKRKYCFRQHCHCNPWNSGLQEALAARCFFKDSSATNATVGNKSSEGKARASRGEGGIAFQAWHWVTDLGGYLLLKYSRILWEWEATQNCQFIVLYYVSGQNPENLALWSQKENTGQFLILFMFW